MIRQPHNRTNLVTGVVALALAVTLGLGWSWRQQTDPDDAARLAARAGMQTPAAVELEGSAMPAAVSPKQPVPPANSDDCAAAATLAWPGKSEEEIAQELRETADWLASASEPDLRLAALFIHPDGPPAAVEPLARRVASDPFQPQHLWNLLGACESSGQDTGSCETRFLARQAREYAPESGEIWRALAGRWHRQDNAENALAALQTAATAAELPAYWPEQMQMLDRALQSTGRFSYVERAALALHHSSFPILYWDLLNACRQHGPDDADWRESCASLGARLERDGASVIAQRAGLVLQSDAARNSGNSAAVAAVEQRSEELLAVADLAWVTDSAILASERLMSGYIDHLIAGGEAEAMRFAADELERAGYENSDAACEGQ